MIFKKSHKDERAGRQTGMNKSLKRIPHVIIITIMLAGLSMNTVFAKVVENAGLSTIYHVYSSGEYIGMLSDEQQLEQLKERKLQQATTEFGELPLSIANELSVIPERVFVAETDDVNVLEKLQSTLTVEAEAVGVSVNDDVALYVKDARAYEELLRQLKLQSVSEAELTQFEARVASTEPLPPLQAGETRVTNILLSANIQSEKGKTAPEAVLSVEQALSQLNKGKQIEKKYVVKSGDVFEKIAAAHKMTTAELLEVNPGMTTETILHIDDELNVIVFEPYVEVEVHYESKKVETIQHKQVTKEDSSAYKGDKNVTQKGVDGQKEVTEQIRKQNGQVIGKSTLEEKTLTEPIDQVTVVGTKVVPSRGTGTFVWPTVGGYVSSPMGARWGSTHLGMDIARPSSRSILAADNGVVTAVGVYGTYGNRIVIKHNNGYETLYGHLASMDVRVGQVVSRGTKIGVMGSTGRSTGVHLHFEVIKNGTNINPMSVLR
ncbi:M23 family metallopeptidase [Sporosarcina sp. FSL K6-1522]|uniref:M23 family metallopeptidase n=1 Tax=Sporosarcina sp. FSL K6-1522 TaxID=2921554 RepID=UPI00315B172C